MKKFIDWVLSEKEVVLRTCKSKVVNVPKGKNEKDYVLNLFLKGSKKTKKASQN